MVWQAIIAAADKKKDKIADSFGDMAKTQSQFAMNGNTGFTPSTQSINPAQTTQNNNNGGFSLLGSIGGMFNKNQNNDNSLGAVGQEVQNQTQTPNLYDYLKM